MSPDGRHALYGSGIRARFVDLDTRVEDTVAYRRGLDSVRSGAFDARGGLVRFGWLGGTSAWFVMDGSTPRALPIASGSLPRWSPDGVGLAFFRLGDTTITLGAASELKTIVMGASVTGLVWSPTGDAVYATVSQADGLSDLVRVDRKAGAPQIIRRRLDASPAFSGLAPSADGRVIYLALASDTQPDPAVRQRPEADRDLDIYALELPSGRLRAVVQGPGDDWCPVLAAGQLYWTHNEPVASVAVLPASRGAARVVATDAVLPHWSPDGRRIAFTRGSFRLVDWALDWDGWVVEVDSLGQAVGAPQPFVEGNGEDISPAWSPDGRWIAYHSHRGPTPAVRYAAQGSDDVYLRRAAGGPEIRLTAFGWEVGPAYWAPDGRRLVFESWERGGSPGVAKPWIVTIDPASGRRVSVKRIPLPPGVLGTAFEAWSPVRDEIALVERMDGTRQALWTVRPDGRDARRLVDFRSRTYGGVSWTRGGSELVYAALAPDGRMQLFGIARSGGPAYQLTRDPVGLMHPSVSPNGRWIAATRLAWRKELRRTRLP